MDEGVVLEATSRPGASEALLSPGPTSVEDEIDPTLLNAILYTGEKLPVDYVEKFAIRKS